MSLQNSASLSFPSTSSFLTFLLFYLFIYWISLPHVQSIALPVQHFFTHHNSSSPPFIHQKRLISTLFFLLWNKHNKRPITPTPTPTQMWSLGVLFSEERVRSMGNEGNMMERTGPNGTLNLWGSSVRFRPSEEYQAYFSESISTFHLLILPVFCYFYKSLVLYISLVIPV